MIQVVSKICKHQISLIRVTYRCYLLDLKCQSMYSRRTWEHRSSNSCDIIARKLFKLSLVIIFYTCILNAAKYVKFNSNEQIISISLWAARLHMHNCSCLASGYILEVSSGNVHFNSWHLPYSKMTVVGDMIMLQRPLTWPKLCA